MLLRSSLSLNVLFYKVLTEIKDKIAASDFNDDEEFHLLPIFQRRMFQYASEYMDELLVNAVNTIKNI